MLGKLAGKAATVLRSPRKALAGKLAPLIYWQTTLRERQVREAKRGLEETGLLQTLQQGREGEFKAEYYDLYNLYRQMRTRKPRRPLEFGSGFSTVVLATALLHNIRDGHYAGTRPPKLITIEANAEWMANTKAKMPAELLEVIEFHHSPCRAHLVEGEVASLFDTLPDIHPDFVYLDGPSPRDVQGDVHGLSFQNRSIVAADMLLYEGTMQGEAVIIVDSRQVNVEFLRRHLKRKWRFHLDPLHKIVTFQLLDGSFRLARRNGVL